MADASDQDGVVNFASLTTGEQRRLRNLLDAVSTRTLLRSLMGLDRESVDSRLIIATLLDRLPAYGNDLPNFRAEGRDDVTPR